MGRYFLSDELLVHFNIASFYKFLHFILEITIFCFLRQKKKEKKKKNNKKKKKKVSVLILSFFFFLN